MSDNFKKDAMNEATTSAPEKPSSKKVKDHKVEDGYALISEKDVPAATKDRQPLTMKLMNKVFNDAGFTIIDSSFKWNTLYIAKKDTGNKDLVTASVVLLKYFDNEIHYKIIDENTVPQYFDCPKRMIKALSETTNPNALEWRNKVSEGFKAPVKKAEKTEKVSKKADTTKAAEVEADKPKEEYKSIFSPLPDDGPIVDTDGDSLLDEE